MSFVVYGTLIEMCDGDRNYFKTVQTLQPGDYVLDPVYNIPSAVYCVMGEDTVHGTWQVCKYMGLCADGMQSIFVKGEWRRLNELVPTISDTVQALYCIILDTGRLVCADGVVCATVNRTMATSLLQ